MVKCFPYTYENAHNQIRRSLSLIEFRCERIGLPFCSNTAPSPWFEASTCTRVSSVEVAQGDFLAYKPIDLLECRLMGWRRLDICIILEQLAEHGCMLRLIKSKRCHVCQDPKEYSQMFCTAYFGACSCLIAAIVSWSGPSCCAIFKRLCKLTSCSFSSSALFPRLSC